MKTTENTHTKPKEKFVKSETTLPEYRPVLFIDNSNSAEFIIASTVHSTETGKAKADGKEYPVYRLEISSSSHPFYTGKEKTLDTAGRVEKFKSRVAAAKKSK